MRYVWESFLYCVWCFFILCVVVAERAFGHGKVKEITAEDRVRFWETVRLCLAEFHGYDAARADEAVAAYRSRPDPGRPRETDAFYHGEPFYVANDIAGRHLRLGEGYGQRYDLMKSGVITRCDNSHNSHGQKIL